jgi:hypothetical protein
MHYGVSRLTKLFTENVLACGYVEHSEEEPLGKMTLFNGSMKVRSRVGVEEEIIKFTSEKERIQALQDKFGLSNLPSEAESNIKKRGIALA